ncbi:MAG: hypothetical protein RJA22_211 [Verrucomicrobiota bacterium]|jgi:hypothetical protein
MNPKALTALAALGAFLVVAVLVQAMKRYTAPAPLNQARAMERAAALKEVREGARKALSQPEVTDAGKGFFRVRIDTAMEMTVAEYTKDAAGARTNLIARANKLAEPPPKEPEKPSVFE